MSTNVPNNLEDQEIDLSKIYNKTVGLFQDFNAFLFRCIQFFIKKIILIIALLIVGLGLGYYLDETQKTYYQEIIVTPNFSSTDYLYSKINLIQSKIEEGDTVFLKKVVGIKRPGHFKEITIFPIIDVYRFIEDKPQNFELIKLMAGDGEINKVITNHLTSKNYTFHTILIKTNKLIDDNETLEPLLKYLNDSDFYKKHQNEVINNIQIKITQNDSIISQINNVLNSFSSNVNSNQKNSQLVYYNENTQLNNILETKETLINEQGLNRISLVGLDKIIKVNSTTKNIRNTDSINKKLKFILPLLFVLIYILFRFFSSFYQKQVNLGKKLS